MLRRGDLGQIINGRALEDTGNRDGVKNGGRRTTFNK